MKNNSIMILGMILTTPVMAQLFNIQDSSEAITINVIDSRTEEHKNRGDAEDQELSDNNNEKERIIAGFEKDNINTKEGSVVDNLWIDHSPGQNEGIIGYQKNENVTVTTVKRGFEVNTELEVKDLSPIILNPNTKILLKENESIVEKEPIVVNPNLSINDKSNNPEDPLEVEIAMGKVEVILLKMIEDNQLIGKVLKVEENDIGDLDMSEFLNMLPKEIKGYHVRVIKAGVSLMLDFRPDRLNIGLDKENKIKIVSVF